MPKLFTTQDVVHYYDQTEVHYRQWWKLDLSKGLHYGIWEKGIKSLPQAILNTNRRLAALSNWSPGMLVLDAGCGVGGSAIYLGQEFGCRVEGITLSAAQVESAQAYAQESGVSKLLNFSVQDYTQTHFSDHSFDRVWAMESMETAADKALFFKEASRLLRPGGQLLIADIFKPEAYPIESYPRMERFLNAWAMSDLLSVAECEQLAEQNKFHLSQTVNVNTQVWPSVWRIYLAGLLGAIGTAAYNIKNNGSYYGRIHYTSGINQFHTYLNEAWEYRLYCFTKV